jgi:hypothetical protein
MLRHRDFVPRMLREAFLLTPAEYESFEDAEAAANTWMEQEKMEIVSIETVVLPNLWKEEGSDDPALRTAGDFAAHWHQFIRVWYRAP